MDLTFSWLYGSDSQPQEHACEHCALPIYPFEPWQVQHRFWCEDRPGQPMRWLRP